MHSTEPLDDAISTIEELLKEQFMAIPDVRTEEFKRRFRFLLRMTLRYLESRRDGGSDELALADHVVTNADRLCKVLEGLPEVPARPAKARR